MKALKRMIKLISGFLEAMRDDHVGAYAAQTAYFIMLSFLPLMIMLLSMIQYTHIGKADIYELISASIVDDPPFSVREGGFIREGYHADVDHLAEIEKNSRGWIQKIEETEREATGIKTLKIGYNRVFGFNVL